MFVSAVILLACLLGGASLYIAVRSLIKLGWFFAWLRGTVGLCFLAFSLLVLWAAYDLTRYDDLFEERPIASISFEKVDDQKYAAILSYYSDRDSVEVDIYGDQWQVDARIIRWTGLIALLGAKPGFRLDRLSGRYLSLEDERAKPRSVFSLAEQPAYHIDMWRVLKNNGAFIPGIDASYGSAAYLPMADSASYELSLSFSGLTAKPTNKIAEEAIKNWQ